MRTLSVIGCMLLATILNAQKLQDFSGHWRIIPEKVQEKASAIKPDPGNVPETPPPPPPRHEYTPERIIQSRNVLKISGGEAGTTAVYTIDPSGKQVSDSIPDAPGSVRIASTHWVDGKLVTEWKLERNGETVMHGTDTRSLTPDGQQIVERIIESARHRAEVRLVMEKVR